MPKTAFLLLITLAGLLAFSAASAAEKIDAFDAVISINSDAAIDVAETIQYDFGETPRHGIYRTIPLHYKSASGNFNLRISNISVTNENGAEYPFKISSAGRGVKIKIGDPDNTYREECVRDGIYHQIRD